MAGNSVSVEQKYAELAPHFDKWEKIKDMVDQNIDLMVNFSQSGHPGGSRSKVQAFIALLLCGGFRWDIRHPEKAFGDRFILSAGHSIPLVYATFAILDEAFRIKYAQTGDARYKLDSRFAVWQEDLARFRRHGGLSGHAEMEGKSLFLKWNTGPSGHGLPAAAGQALALKRAGANEVKVVALEGEGGLTPGASHEAKNSAWGLGLNNLFFLVDWNDFGIDDRPTSAVVHGGPEDWFKPYGWNVFKANDGTHWGELSKGLLDLFAAQETSNAPGMLYFKTRKGRGYGVFDNKSHGAPHKMNSDVFWKTKEAFVEKHGVEFQNYGQPAPASVADQEAQALQNLKAVTDVLARDQALVDYITGTLLALADAVPLKPAKPLFDLSKNPMKDADLFDAEHVSGRTVRCAGYGAVEPRRFRQVGQLHQLRVQGEVRPPDVPGLCCRPRRVDQRRRFRQGLRRQEELRLVRARQEPRGRDHPAGNHRVCQLRHHGRTDDD